jgi:aryl-alcohol dehydrogenase-like predicted oxidoreductase
MKTRNLANTGRAVSEIGLGCWQLGADWGHVSDKEALSILETAVENGVTFFDTADVYGAGRSETLIAKFLQGRQEDVFVATKVGRQNYPGPYTPDVVRQHIDDCRRRLNVEVLDLVQLHCIPPDIMASGEVFDSLRAFKQEGLIKNFGASVESMDEALMILEQPGLTSLQIIFNIFRQKPICKLFDKAMAQNVGIIVRLPLASGLLAGKFTGKTKFAKDDHRNYNADGIAFNVGETFAGLPLAKGAELAERIKAFVPEGMTMAQFSQRWILDHDAVSTVITGASQPSQVLANTAVSELPPLSKELHSQLATIYESSIQEHIRGLY